MLNTKITLLVVASLTLLFLVALPGQASAISRLADCAGREQPAERSACYERIKQKAFAECIVQPEEKRGNCAENYVKAEVDGSEAADYQSHQPSADDLKDTGGTGGVCGEHPNEVKTIISFGCRGQGNPIVDMLFAVIRVLSAGVGIVVVGSVIVGGIQYTTAGGDPQKTANATKRISNSVGALVLYIFIFAILNWLVPGGMIF